MSLDAPLAADDRARLAQALDFDRRDEIACLFGLASKYCATASLAAEGGDLTQLAVRAKQAVASIRQALLVIATLEQAEVAP